MTCLSLCFDRVLTWRNDVYRVILMMFINYVYGVIVMMYIETRLCLQ